jgi:hypothetical protein
MELLFEPELQKPKTQTPASDFDTKPQKREVLARNPSRHHTA